MADFINEIFDIVSKYYGFFLQGIGYTMLIALVGTIVGLIVGLITGIVRTIPKSKNVFVCGIVKVVNVIISIYVEIFRGTPMMVQSMVIYWGYAFYEQRSDTAADTGRYIYRIDKHRCVYGRDSARWNYFHRQRTA